MITFKEAQSAKEYEIAHILFKEYASEIGIDLSFQNFNKELTEIRKQYSRPLGTLFIAFNHAENPIGCLGIRKITASICELKRMYLKKETRGKVIGEKLLLKAIEVAKELKYKSMRLDTLSSMKAAMSLYKKIGFYEIEAYRFNPFEDAKYFEIQLE